MQVIPYRLLSLSVLSHITRTTVNAHMHVKNAPSSAAPNVLSNDICGTSQAYVEGAGCNMGIRQAGKLYDKIMITEALPHSARGCSVARRSIRGGSDPVPDVLSAKSCVEHSQLLQKR